MINTQQPSTKPAADPNGVATVRLNRPPVNAVSKTMQYELKACFDELSEDRTIAAVILAATGERAFSAGIDMREIAGDPATRSVAALLDPGRVWRDAQHAIHHCTVPVLAAVESAVIGAGFGLVGCCDLIIAGEKATFGLTEINVGLLGGASKAIRMLGPFKARRMMFLGHMEPAAELHRLGAVEELVPAGTAVERAQAIGEELATKSPIALRLAKESILRIEASAMETQYRTEQDYTNRLRTFDDSREAMRAFNEKRPPEWTWA